MTGMRNSETMLYQLATVWYLSDQAGRADDSHTADHLERALLKLWHPSYAFHIDVVGVVVRALGRFRFSDPDYVHRSQVVLSEIQHHLAQTGVATRQVVLT